MATTFSSTWASTDGMTDGAPSGSAAGTVGTPDATRLLVFAAAGRSCACELTAVREIVGWRAVTRLPGAPPSVAGLMNLRGAIVTVLDLGVRLGGAPANRTTGSIVLAESGTKIVGLAVDALHDVRRVVLEDIAVAEAEAVSGSAGEEIRGVLHADGDVVVLLDVGRIIAAALA